MNVVEITEQLVRPITDKLGLILWNVEFKKEGADYILRVSIDRDEGVSITDCENVSNELNPLLDEADPIQQSYCLEVTSAGLIRDLKTDAHILKFIGKAVTVKLYKPVNGTKTYEGVMVSYENKILTLDVEGEQIDFPRDDIAKITIDLI